MPRKRVKVLYVCPFAHYAGHLPSNAILETEALSRAGAEVTLLTFYGIVDKTKVKVPHIRVLRQMRVKTQLLLNRFLTRPALLRWPIMVLENFWTVAVAIRLKKKLNYDIILLRDGDPFLFVPFLLSLPLRNYNWFVFLIGGIVFAKPRIPKSQGNRFRMMVYTTAAKLINCELWKPIYRRSMARNHFLFFIPSRAVKQLYDSYLQGVFSCRTVFLPYGQGRISIPASKEEARRHLNLPKDKPLFLCFGVPHPAKDLETVLRALKDTPDVYLVQAGTHEFSTGQNPTRLARDYDILDKIIIRDYYIPEEQKAYYFVAADAVIVSYTRQFVGSGSIVLEACVNGTPVIASDNGELKEVVQASQVGLLFKSQDADSLREAMIRFTRLDKEELESLRANCRRFSDEFSIDRMAQQLLEVFAEMLSNKGSESTA